MFKNARNGRKSIDLLNLHRISNKERKYAWHERNKMHRSAKNYVN